VATTGEAFARARAAARTVAEQGEQQLAAATAILQAAAGAAPVTLSEQGRINTRAAAAAPNPASHEKDVHVAAVALRDAQAALEAKVLPAKALDPTYDPTDPHAVPDVTALLTAVDTAQGKVTDAANAFIGADKTAIDNWEVALPPPLMLLLPDVLRALAVVDRVANRTDLVAVAKALDDSETAYAQALQQQSVRQQHADAAAAEVAARLDDVAAVAPVLDLRVAALVRGDQ